MGDGATSVEKLGHVASAFEIAAHVGRNPNKWQKFVFFSVGVMQKLFTKKLTILGLVFFGKWVYYIIDRKTLSHQIYCPIRAERGSL